MSQDCLRELAEVTNKDVDDVQPSKKFLGGHGTASSCMSDDIRQLGGESERSHRYFVYDEVVLSCQYYSKYIDFIVSADCLPLLGAVSSQ